MKNEVIAMVNNTVTIREEYETAERAHERFTELVRVSKGHEHEGLITIARLQDGYPMATEQFI